MQEVKDITIIGAGPTGLFAAFYAGMRGATCCLIDNLDQVGGQLMALSSVKYILDVAGFIKVLAKDIVKGLDEQAFLFYSSRRRHTRSDRDWSSDVCSSDLIGRAHV